MYIKKVVLKNIRCFENAEIEFDLSGPTPPWAIIVGDNATGKTTLLRNIALGLCDEAGVAGLIKESDAGYIRFNESKGSILINLVDGDGNECTIETVIERINTSAGPFERVRQITKPEYNSFPCNELFVCGYGAGRGTSGTGDIADYSVTDAVYNMFNYREGLQNPELSIHRVHSSRSRQSILETLKKVTQTNDVVLTDSGIFVDGVWGKLPLRDIADGYKSTFLWVSDFIGWAFNFNKSIKYAKNIVGIVIIDELEQHLHATWQRMIINQLKETFPLVQFIAATHSPLITASIGGLGDEESRDQLLLCEASADSSAVKIEQLPTMQGYRFEQVLASRAFKYLIEQNPDLEGTLQRASKLVDKGSGRTAKEEKELERLKKQLRSAPFLKAASSGEREIESEEIQRLKQLEKEAERNRKKK